MVNQRGRCPTKIGVMHGLTWSVWSSTTSLVLVPMILLTLGNLILPLCMCIMTSLSTSGGTSAMTFISVRPLFMIIPSTLHIGRQKFMRPLAVTMKHVPLLPPFHQALVWAPNPCPFTLPPRMQPQTRLAPPCSLSPSISAFSAVNQNAVATPVAQLKLPLSHLSLPPVSSRLLRMSRFATISTELEVARSPSQTAVDNTCVSDVEALMHLKFAHSNGFLPIVTPFIWQKWLKLLDLTGVLQEFTDVPKGIHFGWRLSVIDSFPLNCTYIPNNHKSALEHPKFIISYIHSEVAAGRYSRPFSPDHLKCIIGYFRTSPLGVIPKLGTFKFCLIQDHSFPHNHAFISFVNSTIDSSLFPCDWGTFEDCEQLVTEAPPGTQVAIFDVEAAHRHSPIAPKDQHYICVMYIINGVLQVWIDHAVSFGGASSNGLFSRPGDAIVAIFKSNSIQNLLKWVDDYMLSHCKPILHLSCVSRMSHVPSHCTLYSYFSLTLVPIHVWPLAILIWCCTHCLPCKRTRLALGSWQILRLRFLVPLLRSPMGPYSKTRHYFS